MLGIRWSATLLAMADESRLERNLDRALARATTPRSAAVVIATATTVTAVAAGFLMTVVDRENYPSIGAGLWWAAQTVTTVGYGDTVPVTVLGRFLAVLVMLLGISFLTVITAAITSAFVSRARVEQAGSDAEPPTAEQLREIDRRLERIVELKDAALVVKDDAERVELRQSRLAAGETVVGGGSIGLLLGLAIGVPVAAALLGLAGGGGLAGFHRGISDKRMRKFGEELPPGHAALFALVAKVDWDVLHDRLAPYGGEIAASELDDDVVAALDTGSAEP